ncbi:MAG: hypothetical protein PUP93_33695, partial [Rhizonema sp. NSF051]|nr:hypothetical protein [Rhizonema sp. NSF051]
MINQDSEPTINLLKDLREIQEIESKQKKRQEEKEIDGKTFNQLQKDNLASSFAENINKQIELFHQKLKPDNRLN